MFEKWMRHIKLPEHLRNRVIKYNDFTWNTYKGLDQNEILQDLPASIRNEILENLLNK